MNPENIAKLKEMAAKWRDLIETRTWGQLPDNSLSMCYNALTNIIDEFEKEEVESKLPPVTKEEFDDSFSLRPNMDQIDTMDNREDFKMHDELIRETVKKACAIFELRELTSRSQVSYSDGVIGVEETVGGLTYTINYNVDTKRVHGRVYLHCTPVFINDKRSVRANSTISSNFVLRAPMATDEILIHQYFPMKPNVDGNLVSVEDADLYEHVARKMAGLADKFRKSILDRIDVACEYAEVYDDTQLKPSGKIP